MLWAIRTGNPAGHECHEFHRVQVAPKTLLGVVVDGTNLRAHRAMNLPAMLHNQTDGMNLRLKFDRRDDPTLR